MILIAPLKVGLVTQCTKEILFIYSGCCISNLLCNLFNLTFLHIWKMQIIFANMYILVLWISSVTINLTFRLKHSVSSLTVILRCSTVGNPTAVQITKTYMYQTHHLGLQRSVLVLFSSEQRDLIPMELFARNSHNLQLLS